MSKNAVNRVTTAVGGLVDKIEKLGDDYATKLSDLGDAAEQKLRAVDTQVIDPVMAALSKLDDILFGDNGGPALDDATFQNTVAGVAGNDANAATSAAPEPSKLGAPTGGITSADIAKSE
jgi:hypothetical protein